MERFWSKVEKTEGCWNWTGGASNFGHGRFKMNGKLQSPHRISWILANGPIPDGLWVLHDCDNPACVNPAHLHLGTRSDNMKEAFSRGRMGEFPYRSTHVRGERHPFCTIPDSLVAEIRRRAAAGESGYSLAKIYGLSKGHVYDIIQNKFRKLKESAQCAS